jgi:hypothetical protein
MFKNWKTSLFGLGAVITGVATVLKGLFAAKDSDINLNNRP